MEQEWTLTFGDYITAVEKARAMTSKDRLTVLGSFDVDEIDVDVYDEAWGAAKDAIGSDPSDRRSGRGR